MNSQEAIRTVLMSTATSQFSEWQVSQNGQAALADQALENDRKWYAVFTLSQNERSAARYLDSCQIEAFVPTCESVRVWKNRQRVKIVQALFPTYMFVKIREGEQSVVLQSPGVRRLVGNHKGPVPLPDAKIEFPRSGFCRERVEPYRDLIIGEKVRIKYGPMQGLEGVLVRKKNSMRFVLTLPLINQSAAVEVSADDLEPMLA
jgi:transcription antitermination factor NusG